ncbi:MAG TPA: PQQ-binding-like beta-propeller repeat protein, partial [Actinomycetota bacterium]|nr:PQQ-binding-like beta-propeller repeat protein [Actinomycetota bacterium]
RPGLQLHQVDPPLGEGPEGGAGPSPPASPSASTASPVATAPPSTPPGPPPPSPTPAPINTAIAGLTTFRGNATRTYYGEGPLPRRPVVRWRYPASGAMCMRSTAGGETKLWCGTGWTGQPNVLEHEDGTVEVRFGAYDGRYHFLEGRTGEPLRPDLVTGDLAKGSATSDPDGYPLYYAGSRDDLFRVVALDRDRPTVLWTLHGETSVPNPVWNDDWDGAALVIDDHLFVGGENSWFYAVRLHRGYDRRGRVTVDPEVVAAVPGFDDALIRALGDTDVSIEGSVAFHDGVVYFANSGGLVQGWDVSDVLEGGDRVRRVFRFWAGDDVDATVVIDEEGFLYVAAELQRFTARALRVGQLMKLDPRRSRDPLVWSVALTERGGDGLAGAWATPALHGDVVYAATNAGELLAVDRRRGSVLWRRRLPGPTWSSPVVVDDVLLQGDCAGVLHAYDVSRPRRPPPERWSVRLDGCIESTPAVWHGWIFVGTRGGGFYAIADRRAS